MIAAGGHFTKEWNFTIQIALRDSKYINRSKSELSLKLKAIKQNDNS